MTEPSPAEPPPLPGPGDGVAMSYILLAATSLLALVPGLGLVTWIFALPIVIYAVIVGIRELNKGDRRHGMILAVVSVVAYPLWLLQAPFLLVRLLHPVQRA